MPSRNILFQQTMQYSRGCLEVFSRVFPFFCFSFTIKCLLLQRLLLPEVLKWESKGGIHIHKRRNCTLWFWRLGTSQLQIDLSKTKQRGRPVGCIYIVLWTYPVTVCYGLVFGCVGYIHHRGAFGVARFDKSGNAKASRREASDRLAPRFFCICTYP